MFFLGRLRSFSVCNRLLKIFYQSIVASALFFAVVCWGGGIRAGEASRLNKLVRKASSVVRLELDILESVAERRMKYKIIAILDNPSHPLYDKQWPMGSSFSHRIIPPRWDLYLLPSDHTTVVVTTVYNTTQHSLLAFGLICWISRLISTLLHLLI